MPRDVSIDAATHEQVALFVERQVLVVCIARTQRPGIADGYVAWVGDLTQTELAETLTKWFGPPAPA